MYDITDFIGQHPGGAKRIMLAAGGSVDSFWAMYAQHQKKEVAELLEGYRIGSLVRVPRSVTVPCKSTCCSHDCSSSSSFLLRNTACIRRLLVPKPHSRQHQQGQH